MEQNRKAILNLSQICSAKLFCNDQLSIINYQLI